MKTLKELLAAKTAAAARMKSALAHIETLNGKAKAEEDESRKAGITSLVEDEKTEFDKAKAEIDDLAADITRAKAMADVEGELSTVVDDGHDVNAGKQTEPEHGKEKDPLDPFIRIIEDDRKVDHHEVAAFMNYVAGKTLTDEESNRIAPTDPRHLDSIGGVQGARMPKSFAKVMLSTDTTEYSTDSGSGNLRPDPLIAELLRMPVDMPDLFSLCRQIPAAAGRASWPVLDQPNGGNFGGVVHTWKASEGLTKASTEPYFTDFTIATHELSSWTEMNLSTISRSVIDVVKLVEQLFRDSGHYEWSRVILNGAGTTQPDGIVDYSGINSVTRNAPGHVGWKDLSKLKYALSRGNRLGAFYVLDDTVESDLAETVDGDGRPLFTNSTDSEINVKLAGRPYVAHEHTPQLGTAGDIVLGNWKQYGVGVEENITIARSDHAEFKKGNVVIRMISFIGGKPIQPTAFAQLT